MSSDGDSGNGWEVADSGETYVRSVAQCGGYELVDEILGPLEYALHRNPSGFLKIPGYSSLYLAKTKLRIKGSQVYPACRLWFTIDEQNRKVWKLWIELSAPEEMLVALDPWDDDEPPF